MMTKGILPVVLVLMLTANAAMAADPCDGRVHKYQRVIGYERETNADDDVFDAKATDSYTTTIKVRSKCSLLFDIAYFEGGTRNKIDHDPSWVFEPAPDGNGVQGYLIDEGRYPAGAIAEIRVNGFTVLHKSDGNVRPPFPFEGSGNSNVFNSFLFKCHSRPVVVTRCDSPGGCMVEIMRWNTNAKTEKLLFALTVQKTDEIEQIQTPVCNANGI